ncbi:ABC transporter substrate-binding protein [Rickettsiaceae bacterium]|nr:ABC transporter substrate-binding protein [Rickettsiaceae bacterium]
MNKNIFTKLILLLLMGFTHTCFADKRPIITINQFVSHVSLDSAYSGLMKALLDREIIPNKAEVMLDNAQGNISHGIQIAKHHASLRPDFMVSISTPSSQVSLKTMRAMRSRDARLAFVAVTDPKSANIIGDDHIDVMGVVDRPPVQELVDLAIRIFPDLHTVGVISNAGEINSVKTTDRLEEVLKKNNIQLKKVSISNSNDVKNAMNQLIGKVDIVYLPQDNIVASSINSIVAISKEHKIPLISNDPAFVDKGVMMALGANYFDSGKQLGNMIADTLEGKSLTDKIQKNNANELKINHTIVEELGISIPEDIAARINMGEEE